MDSCEACLRAEKERCDPNPLNWPKKPGDEERHLSLLTQDGARWTGTHLWSHKTEDWNGETARALSQDRSIERVGANQCLLRNDGPKSQRLWESQRIC